jgi:hypothetical protein
VRRPGLKALTTLGLCLTVLAGCGATAPSRPAASPPIRTALQRYLAQIEPLRLAVNRLLNGADPILEASRGHRITAAQAARRMGALERRFAAFTVDIASIQPAAAPLRRLHAEYAHTYILEDAYLSALVSGLAEHNLDHLPNTQSAQRAAIIHWRTGLTVLARRVNLALPADLQQAGRGEIAPSPGGS